MTTTKRGQPRLDQLLVERGLAPSRERARALVLAREVRVDGAVATRPAAAVAPDADLALRERPRYVSRGGEKLAATLDATRLDVTGKRCLDVGASTGGFTDCLLQAGAKSVVAVDVGYGQLAERLRRDPRVQVVERTHASRLPESALSEPIDLVTVDVSFISVTRILPRLHELVAGATLLVLVKPQFEVGRERVGKGGVVRDDALRAEAVDRVRQAAEGLGWRPAGETESVLAGPKGNREIFLLLLPRRGIASPPRPRRGTASPPRGRAAGA